MVFKCPSLLIEDIFLVAPDCPMASWYGNQEIDKYMYDVIISSGTSLIQCSCTALVLIMFIPQGTSIVQGSCTAHVGWECTYAEYIITPRGTSMLQRFVYNYSMDW
jgi:hypothetical protein